MGSVFGQEFRYNFNEDTTVFAAGSYNHRSFGGYNPLGMARVNLDSCYCRVGGGARVQWGDNFSRDGEAGVEQRDYDDLPSTGNDSQAEGYANGRVNWKPSDSISLVIYADYGIQNFNINESPSAACIDPLELRRGLRAHYQFKETTSLITDWNLTRAHGSDVISKSFDDYDFFRGACGLSLNHMFNDRVELFIEGKAVQFDNDMKEDAHFNFAGDGRFGG
jgi:hypothetical protein